MSGRIRLLHAALPFIIAALMVWSVARPLEGSRAVGGQIREGSGRCEEDMHCSKTDWNVCAGPFEHHCGDYEFSNCEPDHSYSSQLMCGNFLPRTEDDCAVVGCYMPWPGNDYECDCD